MANEREYETFFVSTYVEDGITKERRWNIKLTVGVVEDIKETTGVDLDRLIMEPKKLGEFLFTSPKQLVQLLWILCEDQAKAYNVTPRDFGRMFDRPLLDKATDAFLESVLLFYPRTSVGGVLRENLPTMLKDMDAKLEKETAKKVREVLSNMRTD